MLQNFAILGVENNGQMARRHSAAIPEMHLNYDDSYFTRLILPQQRQWDVRKSNETRGSKTNETVLESVYATFVCCQIHLIVSLKCFCTNVINFAVWLISAWPCQLMWFEGTCWLALWLLEFPCSPQRHTQADKVKTQSSARARLHVRQRFKTGKQPEVKSRQEFKAGKSAVWQRSGKHESGTEELMSRTRLQLAKAQRQTKICRVIFPPQRICASAKSLCQVEQLLLYLSPQMRQLTFQHDRQNLVGT